MSSANDYMEEAFERATVFCVELGLEGNTIAKVFSLSDGVFFIQAAAMIETALNSGLAKRFSVRKSIGYVDNEKVLEILEKIQMGTANGKLEIALACELINPRQKKLIEAILTIRNLYAHRFQNFDLPFEDLFNALSKEKQASLRSKFDPDNFRLKIGIGPDKESAVLQLLARMGLVSLIAWIMQFREPTGMLDLLKQIGQNPSEV